MGGAEVRSRPLGAAVDWKDAWPALSFRRTFSSSSQLAQVAPPASQVARLRWITLGAECTGPGSAIRMTRSATRSASRSSGSPCWLMVNLAWMPDLDSKRCIARLPIASGKALLGQTAEDRCADRFLDEGVAVGAALSIDLSLPMVIAAPS